VKGVLCRRQASAHQLSLHVKQRQSVIAACVAGESG
jgi:hypothetical protein